jgi:hypothetical protein
MTTSKTTNNKTTQKTEDTTQRQQEQQSKARLESQAVPEKRAEIRHNDRGFTVAQVDGQEQPKENSFVGLAGLVEQVKQLQEDGYVVSVQDSEGRLVELKD